MKIGLFSDSHDNMKNITKAVDIFVENGVKKIIHCGDLVAPFIGRAMTRLHDTKIETIGVFGNNDGERDHMNELLGKAMKIKGDFMELTLQGKKTAVYHGTDQRILDNLIKSQKYDLILTGHTHQIRVETFKKTLVVNPGETCGYLTDRATCAIINLEDEKKPSEEAVEIVDIAEGLGYD